MKVRKRIGLVMLVVLVGIQFIPSRTNHDKAVPAPGFIVTNGVPENIRHILRTTCYNCHSNNTSYPWYSRLQPIGWFLQNHIDKGKFDLNFSEFGFYSVWRQKSKLRSMVSQVEKDKMPLTSYTFIHREAVYHGRRKKFLSII